ncbi:hypothetical protein ACIBQX_33235 [Nonomuraea sp. NPDC049714]|uniref:hypothetical protein n=1 Tax=Nonomuraea sp. NPDC049714 TaxID=3364357 RepID=UPI0037BC7288
MTQPPDEPVPAWEPYRRPPKDRIRITETSCCGAYEWACRGGQFLILRQTTTGRYEETARGLYRHARPVWQALLVLHEDEHKRKARARIAARSKRRGRALPENPAA